MKKATLENHLNSPFKRFVILSLLAVVIYFSDLFGHLFGFAEEGYISVIWPAAGVALATMLLFGYRCWPGILLGNILYNINNILGISDSLLLSFILGIIISLGSLLQTFMGTYIMRNLSSPGLFQNSNDMFIFLVPAGLLTCIIASTIGVSLLSIAGLLKEDVFNVWLTFWVGDTFGIYLFTPLLLIWLFYKPFEWTYAKVIEALGQLTLILAVCYLTFFKGYPLVHLIFPVVLWITFRFTITGAVIAIFITSLLAAWGTLIGYNNIFTNMYPEDPLLIFISYIGVIAAVSLVVAGILNERLEALTYQQGYNVALEEMIHQRTQELHHAKSEIGIKEKLATMGSYTANIAREIKTPLSSIRSFTKAARDCLEKIHAISIESKKILQKEKAETLEANITSLDNCLKLIQDYQENARAMVVTIIQHSAENKNYGLSVKSINLHILINQSLHNALKQLEMYQPRFIPIISKIYDKSVVMLEAFPDDLSLAFANIFSNIWDRMEQKQKKTQGNFIPTLEIKTEDNPERVKITLKDNGAQINQHTLEEITYPHTGKKIESGSNTGLAKANEVIVNEHHGELTITGSNDQNTTLVIFLPKSLMPKIFS